MSQKIFEAKETEFLLTKALKKLPSVCFFTSLIIRGVLVMTMAIGAWGMFAMLKEGFYVVLFFVAIILPSLLEFSFTVFSVVSAGLHRHKNRFWKAFLGVSILGLLYNAFQLYAFADRFNLDTSLFIKVMITLQFANIVAWAMSEASALLIVGEVKAEIETQQTATTETQQKPQPTETPISKPFHVAHESKMPYKVACIGGLISYDDSPFKELEKIQALKRTAKSKLERATDQAQVSKENARFTYFTNILEIIERNGIESNWTEMPQGSDIALQSQERELQRNTPFRPNLNLF